ncbi:continuous vascular RING family protein [Populus alba x Populus x berolinensis]|nr:continuous vascular RING family protein [Populus alba x Populus x berolinensis]
MTTRDRDLERLKPLQDPDKNIKNIITKGGGSKSSILLILAILLPVAITVRITWWFIGLVDGFFSPIYAHLGVNIFGLGFVTSISFIFLTSVFMPPWLGASVLGLGEWFIRTMPFASYI